MKYVVTVIWSGLAYWGYQTRLHHKYVYYKRVFIEDKKLSWGNM